MCVRAGTREVCQHFSLLQVLPLLGPCCYHHSLPQLCLCPFPNVCQWFISLLLFQAGGGAHGDSQCDVVAFDLVQVSWDQECWGGLRAGVLLWHASCPVSSWWLNKWTRQALGRRSAVGRCTDSGCKPQCCWSMGSHIHIQVKSMQVTTWMNRPSMTMKTTVTTTKMTAPSAPWQELSNPSLNFGHDPICPIPWTNAHQLHNQLQWHCEHWTNMEHTSMDNNTMNIEWTHNMPQLTATTLQTLNKHPTCLNWWQWLQL